MNFIYGDFKLREIKVGYAPIKQPIFDQEWAEDMYQRSNKLLSSLKGVKIIRPEGTVTTEEDAQKAGELFHKEDVDLVLMESINSDSGILATIMGQKASVPIILWSTPEPIEDGKSLKANSLCGAMIIAGTLRRLNLKYKHIEGYPEDLEFQKKLKDSINVLGSIAALRESKLGLVGYVAPGFHHASFDEILVRKTFGVQIHHVDLSEVFSEAEALTKDEIDKEIDEMKKRGKIAEGVTEEDFKKTASITLALEKIVKKYGITALAVKCFPEFQDLFKFAPCAVLGRCNDKGIMTACEGDMIGTLTMVLENYLTGNLVFFTDIIDMNDKTNIGIVWHCGQGVTSLAEDPESVTYKPNFLFNLGLTTELACKPGPVTVARISERENTYRVYAFEGEAVKVDAVLRGAQMNVKFDQPIEKIREIIFEDGVENHFAVVHGRIGKKLREFAKWFGIESVIM